MPSEEFSNLPFITRKMLAFEHGAKFQLLVSYVTSNVETVRITGSTREGPFTFDIPLAAGVQTGSSYFGIPDIPLWIAAGPLTAGTEPSGCHLDVSLYINETITCGLCMGNATSNTFLVWPNPAPPTPLQLRGEVLKVTGTDPAANVEISETMNAQTYCKLKSIRFTLVTDANVANRRVELQIKDSASALLSLPAIADQVAGTTVIYTWGEGLPTISDATGLKQQMSLPADFVIPPSGVITTVTKNRQATDNFGAPIYVVERQMVFVP